jgi:hypothetical protein
MAGAGVKRHFLGALEEALTNGNSCNASPLRQRASALIGRSDWQKSQICRSRGMALYDHCNQGLPNVAGYLFFYCAFIIRQYLQDRPNIEELLRAFVPRGPEFIADIENVRASHGGMSELKCWD